MTSAARPPLPPDVDPDLWFDIECGRHYLLDGNPHTHPGRMDAYCPEHGIRTRVSKAEIGACSEQTRYFIRGFLSGSEPAPPDSADGTDPACRAWSEAAARFRDTGVWRDETPEPDEDELPEELLAEIREQQTARVSLVVDLPTSDTDRAVEVATKLAQRVGRRACDAPGPVEVSAPMSFTRVYALVGVTGHRPWVAVHTAMTALGRSGWSPATAVEGEQYVTADFKANRALNRGLDALGVTALEIHAAYGLGHDPSRTPGSRPHGG
ncbi:hypothetical protein [Paractinoplanes atraurantiacus]|uniref:Uncharacterized protein n=1 Tax=Paractinoplanes atraurantiacus TaxID=1036182 RepID=A0A285JWM3_9ACTN|nr:hypothetical protein [Actinoplanes atraurantiacus]SNY64719.1 hypothetical protein SAMN05421748_12728 [Actinoplanes atraurantiacus]